MKTVRFEKEAPVRYTADVVVVGAGVAGTAAAVACAREGKSVILIEKSGCLGGLATNGHVSPFDATHSRSGKSFGGIAQEILDEMDEMQRMYGVPTSCVKREGPHLFKLVLLKMANEAGVEILFHADLLDAVRENDKIKYLLIHTKSGVEALCGKVYIDASGDGDLFFLAGEEFFMGSEADCGKMLEQTDLNHMHYEDNKLDKYTPEVTNDVRAVQPTSVMFTMGGVDLEKHPQKYNNKNLTFADLGIDKEEFRKLPYYGTCGF